MSLRNRTRLHKLCSRALAENDPQKLTVLLTEIDAILSETVAELSAMLKDVEQVLSRPEQLSEIQLVKRIETHSHEAGFYYDDRQFLEHLRQFVGAALKGGDAAILGDDDEHLSGDEQGHSGTPIIRRSRIGFKKWLSEPNAGCGLTVEACIGGLTFQQSTFAMSSH
jgi:hypothetical protein